MTIKHHLYLLFPFQINFWIIPPLERWNLHLDVSKMSINFFAPYWIPSNSWTLPYPLWCKSAHFFNRISFFISKFILKLFMIQRCRNTPFLSLSLRKYSSQHLFILFNPILHVIHPNLQSCKVLLHGLQYEGLVQPHLPICKIIT